MQHYRQAFNGFGGEAFAPRRRSAVPGMRVAVDFHKWVTAGPPGIEDDDCDDQDEREEDDEEEERSSMDLEIEVVQIIRVVPVEFLRIVVHLNLRWGFIQLQCVASTETASEVGYYR